MINFKSFTLKNGLRVVVHEDPSSTIVAINVMYQVGSRDEHPHKTGLAHLFEHLMFGTSQHAHSYDSILHQAGGDSNAYTTPDVTNYYCTLPPEHLEIALFLEASRMSKLSLDPQVLAVQKSVVIEEFKERYLNQPYGEVWLELFNVAYTQHPYQWPTIGKNQGHIESITMQDVKAFYDSFYTPNNAILVVAGKVRCKVVKLLVEKWFSPIKRRDRVAQQYALEPPQTSPKYLKMTGDVPLEGIYKAYHMPGSQSPHYHATMLLADILGMGKSSRLYNKLVECDRYLNTVNTYITETIDPGLLIISGKLNEHATVEVIEQSIKDVFASLQQQPVTEEELESTKNKLEMDYESAKVDLTHRAQALATATMYGDTDLVNKEVEKITSVTPQAILEIAQTVLTEDNCTTVYYSN